MGIFDRGAAKALNHLLERETWARRKLAPFAGEIVELRCEPLPPVRLVIIESGCTVVAEEHREATLVITAGAGILGAMARGEDHLIRELNVSGNPQLAAEILAMFRYLRWDVEEDLSRVVGDVAAHRIAGAARAFATWQADAGKRLAENLLEYAVEERRLIVTRAEFDDFAANVARLRDDLARLEQRIDLESGPTDTAKA